MPTAGVNVEDNISQRDPQPSVRAKRVRAKQVERTVRHQREAATAEHVAGTVKASMEAAVASLPLGISIWAYVRCAEKLLSAADLTRGRDNGDVLHPGVKAWIADNLGLVAGPVVAQTLPSDLHNNGLHIADERMSVTPWIDSPNVQNTDQTQVEVARREIEDEGWFTAVLVVDHVQHFDEQRSGPTDEYIEAHKKDHGDRPEEIAAFVKELLALRTFTPGFDRTFYRVAGVRFSPSTCILIALAMGLGVVGLTEAAKGIGSALGRVIP